MESEKEGNKKIEREKAHQVSLVKEYPEDRILTEKLFDDFQFSPMLLLLLLVATHSLSVG